MVTANQNYDAHTKKKKQSKHNTKDNHQITREEHNRGRGRKKKKKKAFLGGKVVKNLPA